MYMYLFYVCINKCIIYIEYCYTCTKVMYWSIYIFCLFVSYVSSFFVFCFFVCFACLFFFFCLFLFLVFFAFVFVFCLFVFFVYFLCFCFYYIFIYNFEIIRSKLNRVDQITGIFFRPVQLGLCLYSEPICLFICL
jgi:hypothetical protein